MDSVEVLETDYLVVGAGAMGMAFVDELLTRSPNAQVVLVDRRARPGGHWNDAYPFVSLHQPAAFYGVNSEPLGSGGAELASGTEVLSYFNRVLKKLLATGRVKFLPLCDYTGSSEGGSARINSRIVNHKQFEVTARKKTVDATYMNVQVPSTTPPRYEIAEGCRVIPPNDLPNVTQPPAGHVVIGAGKTGMDAILFLVSCGVEPDSITWIVSNDAWLLDRDMLTPGRTIGWFVNQLELFAKASSLNDVLDSNERALSFLRIDSEIVPKKFRCATVNRKEVEVLRSIKNVVRLGRVQRIEREKIVLDGGDIPTTTQHMHVDCTADGLAKRPPKPVFEDNRITLQSLFMCQQVFSASAIAFIESRYGNNQKKNELCRVVPHPEFACDYVSAMAVSNANFNRWAESMAGWMKKSRLSLAHHESALKLLFNTFRARRVGRDATAGMRAIFEQEFPDQEFPG